MLVGGTKSIDRTIDFVKRILPDVAEHVIVAGSSGEAHRLEVRASPQDARERAP